MNYKEQIKALLKDPENLKKKKPFTRGFDSDDEMYSSCFPNTVEIGETADAVLPNIRKIVVPQSQFLRELDPMCHEVLFNNNLPSICIKTRHSGYREIKFERMAVPIQQLIKGIQLIYLTAHNMQFTLDVESPEESQYKLFTHLKQMWEKRNQDGMRNKMVDTQMSCGDAGLLYYFDHQGHVKSKILSYKDGYVLCPHNDEYGDRILESVYYSKDGVEYIDSYDEKYMYRYTNKENEQGASSWVLEKPKKHGFEEIPLITKRGDVPWNGVQPIINTYEEQYNIFNAIQRRFGWGILYIKGKFRDEGKKIAGSVVMNDTSPEGKGDAKFLTPPDPQHIIEYLKLLISSIQLGSQTTFVLPEDIKMTGDVSGLAVQVTKELDIQKAMQNVIDWQNVADKMLRLFKYGLAVEMVKNGESSTAITDFKGLNVTAKFKVWRPFNEYEFNQMLTTMTGAGILSKESGTELCTVSKPDEKARINRQIAEEEAKAIEHQKEMLKLNPPTPTKPVDDKPKNNPNVKVKGKKEDK